MINQSLNGVEAVLLVGGPAGCGKTTIAQDIVSAPEQFDLPKHCPHPVHRTDWKSLPSKKFHNGTVIVEFATNRLSDPEQLQIYSSFIDSLAQATIIQAAYSAPIERKALLKRYLQRMEPSHFLHFGKWKSWLGYLLANRDDDFGVETWEQLLDIKSIPCRTWPIQRKASP